MAQYFCANRVECYGDKRERCIILAEYIIDTGCTVREAAVYFGISKSTVHKDITSELKRVNYSLYESVGKVLNKNKSERHLRGGLATKRKYSNIHESMIKV